MYNVQSLATKDPLADIFGPNPLIPSLPDVVFLQECRVKKAVLLSISKDRADFSYTGRQAERVGQSARAIAAQALQSPLELRLRHHHYQHFVAHR